MYCDGCNKKIEGAFVSVRYGHTDDYRSFGDLSLESYIFHPECTQEERKQPVKTTQSNSINEDYYSAIQAIDKSAKKRDIDKVLNQCVVTSKSEAITAWFKSKKSF